MKDCQQLVGWLSDQSEKDYYIKAERYEYGSRFKLDVHANYKARNRDAPY